MEDKVARFIEALWYDPKKDPLLPPELYSTIQIPRDKACIKVDVEGQNLLVDETILDNGLQVDGSVLFVFEDPSLTGGQGLLDSFIDPDDYDESHRGEEANIVCIPPDDVKKAQEALNRLKSNKPKHKPGSGFKPS